MAKIATGRASGQPVTPTSMFRALWRKGYHRLVPIIPPNAPLSERSTLHKRLQSGRDDRGKTPGVRNPDGLWRGYDWRASNPEESDLDRWQAMGAGIGIKTGPQPDGTWLLLIDADTLDNRHATQILDAVRRHFGPLAVRIGQAPKAGYPVRTSAPFAYARVEFDGPAGPDGKRERVEILSDGKQFVAAGLHPATGELYSWRRIGRAPDVPVDPGEIEIPAFSDLPVIEPAALLKFLDDLRSFLPGAGAVRREGGNGHDVNQASLAGSPVLVREALRRLPNTSANFPAREDWRDVGYAIKAALPDAPHEALGLFQDWSAQWEGRVDDEGRHVTNEPEQVEAEWQRMQPPFRRGIGWLCETVDRITPPSGDATPLVVDRWFDVIPDAPPGATAGFAGGGAGDDDWPEPLDLWSDHVEAEFRDVAQDALPPVIWRYAQDEAVRGGVPVIFVAVGALAAVAGAAGAKFRLQPKARDASWLVTPFTWWLVIAPSGSRKSSSLAAALAPLKATNLRWAREDEPHLAAWDAARRQRQRKGKAAEGQAPVPGPRPRRRVAVVSNFTTEGLRDTLLDNPAGVLIDADEVSGVIEAAGQYKGGRGSDRADLLKLTDGEPLTVTRAGSGPVTVPCWGASVLGGTQPGVIARCAQNLGTDGLLQRFMPVYAARITGNPTDTEPDLAARFCYADRVEFLANVSPAAAPAVITLSPGAIEVRNRFDTRVRTLLDATPDEAFASHLSKWTGNFARILLLFHLADGGGETQVSVDMAERAERFASVMLSHAYRTYEGLLTASSPLAPARIAAYAVLKHAEKGNALIKPRDIYREHRAWTPGQKESRTLYAAMQVLVAHGWARPTESRDAWLINPKAVTRNRERLEAERMRRAECHQAIKEAGAIRAAILRGAGTSTDIFT